MLLLVALRYIDRFGVYGAMDGMVELNTFFLVGRRSLPIVALQPVCNVLYWATYPLFRLFMYGCWCFATWCVNHTRQHKQNTLFTQHQHRYPYVLYLLLDELKGDTILAAIIYPCQLFLVFFNCLLLYMTFPWPQQQGKVGDKKRQPHETVGGSREGPLAGVGRKVRDATQGGVLHPDGRVRMGMAPRVLR